jgi:Cdc6-like AAA superfamily ATPase
VHDNNDAEESFESGQAPDVKEDYRPQVTKQVIGMLQEGHSICITGEVGIGKTHLARLIAKNFEDKYCYGNYRGDNTKCLQQIATSLDVPIEADGKFFTAKQLKEEIAINLGKNILICDHFHKWPASLKGWVEDLHESGAIIVLLGSHRDLEGVAYKIPRLVLSPLLDEEIRSIALAKASSLALSLTTIQVSEIASRSHK